MLSTELFKKKEKRNIQCNAGKRMCDLDNLENGEWVAGFQSCFIVISCVYPTLGFALVQPDGRIGAAGKCTLSLFFFSADYPNSSTSHSLLFTVQ